MPLSFLLCAVLLGGDAGWTAPAPVTGTADPMPVRPSLLAGAVPPEPGGAVAPAVDAWIGEDKARHFLMSFGITMMGYGAARAGGAGEADARLAAAAGSGLAGVGKEIHDLRAGGPFSVRDLAWDAGGIAAAVLVLFNIR